VVLAIWHTVPPNSQVLQSALLLPFAAMLGNPFDVEPTEVYILAAFGLLFAIASVTLAEGAKRVPSGQTGSDGSLKINGQYNYPNLINSLMPSP
jgi:hypothetical protein